MVHRRTSTSTLTQSLWEAAWGSPLHPRLTIPNHAAMSALLAERGSPVSHGTSPKASVGWSNILMPLAETGACALMGLLRLVGTLLADRVSPGSENKGRVGHRVNKLADPLGIMVDVSFLS